MQRILLGLLAVAVTFPQFVSADTVQLSVRGGRISIVADRATPAQILQAWSEQGHVIVVNADRVSTVPLTLRLDNIPEEQALDVLLRAAGGYLARRRETPAAEGSVFDRIVITPAPPANAPPAVPQAATVPAAPAPATPSPRPVFVQPAPPATAPAPSAAAVPGSATAPASAQPQGIPVAPGVVRLVGPDGRPLADDQADAPPPPQNVFPPTPTPVFVPPQARPAPPQSPPQQTPTPSTSAPAGVPRTSTTTPGPAATPPSPGQPRR